MRVMSDESVLDQNIGSAALDRHGIVTVRDGETVDHDAVCPVDMAPDPAVSRDGPSKCRGSHSLDIESVRVEREPTARESVDDGILDRKIATADRHVPVQTLV